MGKYIKSFEYHDDYLDFRNSSGFSYPNVSYCIEENEVHYNPMIIESLASLADLGENPDNVLWTPTSDELMYIQTAFDAAEEDSVDWSSATLYVTKQSSNYNIWGNGISWQIAVDFNYKIDYFYEPTN